MYQPMATHKSMLEEPWKNIKMLPITPPKKHSIIPTKDGKFNAAEVSAGTFKEYTFLQMLMLNVSFSLQVYSTQLSSPVPFQY